MSVEKVEYKECGNCGGKLHSDEAKYSGICDYCIGDLFAWEEKENDTN